MTACRSSDDSVYNRSRRTSVRQDTIQHKDAPQPQLVDNYQLPSQRIVLE